MKERSNLIQTNKTANDNLKDKIKTELIEIEKQIANLSAQENRKKVFDNFGELSNTDGTTNMNGIWGLKRKMFPKNSELNFLVLRFWLVIFVVFDYQFSV